MNTPETPNWDPLPDLIPVRMLNEFVYCPRLAYLEWVQGEFADSADTVEGRYRHRGVDSPPEADRPIPEPGQRAEVRSVAMSAPDIGLTAVLDLVEIDDRRAVPVDFKRGARPRSGCVYDPERVQLCAQGLILEANGFEVDHGVTYFAASKERVEVAFTAELRALTMKALGQLREAAASGRIPEPLDDSPKCPRCSLAGICLPDETELLGMADRADRSIGPPRMILPSPDESLPVYVQDPGARIGKSGGVLQIHAGTALRAEIPMHEISHLALFGPVQISTQAMQTLCARNIPVCMFTTGGWFYGMAHGLGHKNVELRIAQYRAAADQDQKLRIARRIVSDKVRNSRTLLRRNGQDVPERVLGELAEQATAAETATGPEQLLGIEGNAARIYFQSFSSMLKQKSEEGEVLFSMEGRNRRPPRDPINSLLSFAYALLTKTWTVTVQAAGFDPFLGFYHSPRYGRPALALDMMEPFRPLIADSTVISAINGAIVKPGDFTRRLGAVALTEDGRRAFVQAFERRLGQEVTHPVFGYKITYRQVLEVQARLLGRMLLGEVPDPPSFVTR